jgi:hypothetical protein
MIYLLGVMVLLTTLLVSSISWIWYDTPLLAIAGMVVSSFSIGFILGENSSD